MAYFTPEDIQQAKQLDLLAYLQIYEPDQLVKVSGDTYCTREHDSLKISNDPHYLHTEEKQDGETFFDVMNRLIARSKAVTADMEAVLAELESEIEPFRAPKDHE